jgi:hypothetical protein
MLAPAVKVSEAYGRLISRLVEMLGAHSPATPHEATLRDLIADVFDFLYEWRRPLLEGRADMAYPIGRRAFESLCLFVTVMQDPALGVRWEKGAEIKNAELRRALDKLPLKESEDSLREQYRFFSLGAHPNRELVAHRFLGEGNRYVLGAIAQPSLPLVLEHLRQMVSCWFWFGAATTFHWKELIQQHDPAYFDSYMAAVDKARDCQKWISENFKRVLEEERAIVKDDRIKHSGLQIANAADQAEPHCANPSNAPEEENQRTKGRR